MAVIRQGLGLVKRLIMIKMLENGVDVKEVSNHFEVPIKYVKKFVKEARRNVKDNPGPELNKDIEALTGEQLATGDGYELKDLRAYAVEFYKVELASNSNRESTIKAFIDARNGEK